MPNLHDIERRIGSVSSTKQITRTMEMVAAAKIRLAGERVAAATPYAESMVEMLANVAKRVGGSENALLRKHDEVKNVLIVVVVSDRGLAGGFNSNVLRQVDRLMKSKQRPALRSASLLRQEGHRLLHVSPCRAGSCLRWPVRRPYGRGSGRDRRVCGGCLRQRIDRRGHRGVQPR